MARNRLKNLVLFSIITVVISNQLEDESQIDDLKNLEAALHEASAYMKKEAKYENVAVCMGSTRSGKSTLINYIIGNELIGEKVTTFSPVTLKKTDNSPGPQIGSGFTSKTIIPTRWNSNKFPGMGIWDSPGFDDNRGPVQDITNAYYIYQLLRNVKSLKIVLVTDINDITKDNIRPFLSLLDAVENLLKEKMRSSFGTIAVIFTKVPNTLNDNPVDMDLLNNLLEDKFLSNSEIDISEPSKDFIRYLIRNNQNIGFFKRASIGPVTSAIDVGITEAIQHANRLEGEDLKEISPSISDSSKIFLFETRQKLYSIEAFEDLQKVVLDVLDRKLYKYGRMDGYNAWSLRTIKRDLSSIRYRINGALFDSTISFQQKIGTLRAIDPAIEKLIENLGLIEKFNLMDFVDELLNLDDSKQFDSSIHRVMISALTKVNELIVSVETELEEIARREAREEMIREQERYRLQVERMRIQLEDERRRERERKRGFWRSVFWFLP